MPTEVSMNLQSYAVAIAFPSANGAKKVYMDKWNVIKTFNSAVLLYNIVLEKGRMCENAILIKSALNI